MRLIARKRLAEFAAAHSGTKNALSAWADVAEQAAWKSIDDVRNDFPSADGVTVDSGRTVTVFNIRGGNYRLITAIHYNTGILYLMRFLTHAEYDKDRWKDQL